MNITETVSCKDRKSWRTWLERNHGRKNEIWLVFYKKHTGKPTVSYGEAVEEAICFGWIDSILQRLDDERYAQKFTPRRAITNWSETNIMRAKKMIREGRMAAAGLEKFKGAKAVKPVASRKDLRLSPGLLGILQASKRAHENFLRLPPSLRSQYSAWVVSAKKEETRLKRLRELVAVLEKGGRLGLK